MWWGFVTLFPELVHASMACGVVGRAQKEGRITVRCFNPREHTQDKHRRVDDRPYGGGPGMVLKPEPLVAAIEAAKKECPDAWVVALAPAGRVMHQKELKPLIQHAGIVCVSGRYEGIDQRVLDAYVDEVWSLGDYVLSGGELPALVLADAVTRLLPGVLGDDCSSQDESFASGLLEYPQYTRPASFRGHQVPEVLQSGDHAAVAAWRQKQALATTARVRPDLLHVLAQQEHVCE